MGELLYMASRPELVLCCEELDIDHEGMDIQQMKEAVRERADKLFNKKWHVSADNLSDTLKHFLTTEADWIIKDQDGNIINF